MSGPLEPVSAVSEPCQIQRFIKKANEQYALSLDSDQALHEWSLNSPSEFWALVWEFAQVTAAQQGSIALAPDAESLQKRWFPQAKFNLAENLLRFQDDRPALFFSRAGRVQQLSHAELYKKVAQLALAMEKKGIGPGDRIASLLPNTEQAVICFLATASLGAIWIPYTSRLTCRQQLTLLKQAQPRLIFASLADTQVTLNQLVDLTEHLALEALVFADDFNPVEPLDLPQLVHWNDFVHSQAGEISFAQLPFGQPLYLRPVEDAEGQLRLLVQGAGGTFIQSLCQQQLHLNLQAGDHLMLANEDPNLLDWQMMALAYGATLVLCPASLTQVDQADFWSLVEAAKVTCLGLTSAQLNQLTQLQAKPKNQQDLSSLTQLICLDGPLTSEAWEAALTHLQPELRPAVMRLHPDSLCSYALSNPLSPIWAGQLPCTSLGLALEVRQDTGEVLINAPFPAQPIGFWEDLRGTTYQATYHPDREAAWLSGFRAETTEQGGLTYLAD